MDNAKTMNYQYSVTDSTLLFDEGFDLESLSSFRDQELNLILEIPYDQPFIMERSLLEILRNTIYRNGYTSSDVSFSNVWVFNEKGLLCLTCIEEEEETEDIEFEESEENSVQSDSTEIIVSVLD